MLLTFLFAAKGAYTCSNMVISVNRADSPTNETYPAVLPPAGFPLKLTLYNWNKHWGVIAVLHAGSTALAASTFRSGADTHFDVPSDGVPASMMLTWEASLFAVPNRVVGCTKLICAATSCGTEYLVVLIICTPSSPLYQSNCVSSNVFAVPTVVRNMR